MNIRYKKSMGILYIVAGVVFACIFFALTLMGGSSATLLPVGVVGIIFGILVLTRTYFVLKEDSLVLNALLGPAKTTYKFQSLQDIQVENNKIYLTQDGTRKKLPIAAWMVDRHDWQAFLQKVGKAQ